MTATAVLLALSLLGLSPDAIDVTVVLRPPADVNSRHAQELLAWVDARDPRRIYIAGWSDIYRKASAGKRDAVIALAGILDHERCHVEQPIGARLETPCYDRQIATLKRLRDPLYHVVVVEQARAMFDGERWAHR